MTEKTKKMADSFIFNTYAREPVTFVRGSGCRLWDDRGKEYLDFVAGIAVCNLGHCPENLSKVICEQSKKLVHVSNLYYTEPQVELAKELIERSFADRVFFCNSGAEANEAALKLARKYSNDRYGPGRFHVISMKNSFHGRTLATLSATGQEKVQKGFEPLVEGFSWVPFDSVEAVEEAMTDKTCAVIVEPIQGEGGVRIPSLGYLRDLKTLCEERDVLLIFDEVQVGMGRTGWLFAHECEGVTPHIMTLAKALANGLPIGAMLAIERVAQAFVPGSHATTFGGTPLVTAVALETLKTIANPEFLEQVRKRGDYLLAKLRSLANRYDFVKEVRGRGLMVGMELTVEAQPVIRRCLEQGIVLNAVQGNVLRFTPPLIVEETDIDRLVSVLDDVFKELK